MRGFDKVNINKVLVVNRVRHIVMNLSQISDSAKINLLLKWWMSVTSLAVGVVNANTIDAFRERLDEFMDSEIK